jgi:hypothetical protein
MAELFAGADIVKVPTGAVTVKARLLAFPSADTLILPLPATNPETTVVAIPAELVVTAIELSPSTALSVEANVTGTPASATLLAFFMVVLKVTVFPPAVREVPPELPTDTVAPLICTIRADGLAIHALQLADTVATRVVWSAELATKVTVASPVLSVVTDESLKIEALVVDKDKAIVAPFTTALDESKARIVKVLKEVPSALKVNGLGAVKRMLATFAVTLGVVTTGVTVTGLLASPPPPPQAVSTAISSTPVIVLSSDIFTALFIPKNISSTNCGQPKPWE